MKTQNKKQAQILAAVIESRKVEGCHKYLYGGVPPNALGVPPIVTLVLIHTVISGPAFTLSCE